MKKESKAKKNWEKEKQIWEDAALIDTLKALGRISDKEYNYYLKLKEEN